MKPISQAYLGVIKNWRGPRVYITTGTLVQKYCFEMVEKSQMKDEYVYLKKKTKVVEMVWSKRVEIRCD